MANVVSDNARVRDIDSQEKNKFRFEWLLKSVKLKHGNSEDDVLIGDSICKVDVSGKALCSLCSDIIYYGKRGVSALVDHVKTKKHSEKVFLKKRNFDLPSNFFASTNAAASTSANASTSVNASTSANASTPHNVPICDRVSNSEALVLGILAEHSLPFSMAEVIIDASKILSEDKKALNHLTMKRASASYKMRFGVAKTFVMSTVENLKASKFSLNVDEATSTNNMRVLSVLCSYFSSNNDRVVIEHLTSLSVNTVNSENLFNAIKSFFEDNDIPWENLVSILMDSCNVMRGSKSGLETRIRNEKAPHLLDVDGDSCHHVHNACKKFSKPFNMWLENLTKDIHNDIKWSPDIRACLIQICDILNVKFVSPVLFIPHRWLSCYDAAVNFIYLLDAITLLYYSFLTERDRTLYFGISVSICRRKNVSSSANTKIKDIQKKLSLKKMTDDGMKRKKRICEKLFVSRRKTCLIAQFYNAVLPLLKRYVCLFQTKEPLIHKVYDEQKQLFLDFLSCFVAQENLQVQSGKELLSIDLSNTSLHLSVQKMFLGSGTKDLISNSPQNKTIEDFLSCAKNAFVDCGKHLQKTLPLNNLFLKCASAIDPTARGHQITCQRLEKLSSLLPNVLSLEEKEKYSLEVFQYQVDLKLPSPIDDSGNLIAVDTWWANIFHMPKYFSMSKIIKAVLSCFHGPQVEGSFNMMADIIDKRSGRMHIETYSAIQTVKYKLLAEKKSAIEYFHRKNLHQPVDKNLCYNLRSSRMEYQKELQEKDEERRQKNNNKNPPRLMKEEIAENSNLEKASRLKHKRKLEIMAQKIQMKKLKQK